MMKVDNVWKMCFVLHNWLLDVDGISAVWVKVNGVCVFASDWAGPLGNLDFDGVRDDVPYAIARLSTNLDPRNYDFSGMGPGEDITGNKSVPYEHSNWLLQSSVSNLTLVDLSFHRNGIVWPSYK